MDIKKEKVLIIPRNYYKCTYVELISMYVEKNTWIKV